MNHTHSETTDTTRLAFQATIHCLTGCGIGEVLGLGGLVGASFSLCEARLVENNFRTVRIGSA